MTSKIQQAVCRWLAVAGDEAICENYSHCWEMDVASMSKGGLIWEYEVKISRSDFLADKKRKMTKFEHYEMKNERTAPNYFCYVCPKGLIKENEIPAYAGLYYYHPDGKIKWVKSAKKIHKIKVDKEKTARKMLRLNIQRKYLRGSMMTFKNRESRKIYDAFRKEQEENRKKNESLFSDEADGCKTVTPNKVQK